MPPCIGVRREEKSQWERRVPITPTFARELHQQHDIPVVVQPSPHRAFTAAEFEAAGATVQEDLSICPIVLAIKEIPKSTFQRRQAYAFFAHVVKGQPFNMPMLQRLLDLDCTLVDYERVTDDQGRRLLFFGRHAGVAGMLETLWALGRRLAWEGIANPFTTLRHPYEYHDLSEAKEDLIRAGEAIRAAGLPPAIAPLTIGVAGYGNVARGTWEILDLLPIHRVEPDDLPMVTADPAASRHGIYATTFREVHTVTPQVPSGDFDLQHFVAHPEAYRSAFERFLPHLTVLVNAVYWEPRFPRLVTNAALEDLFASGPPRLRVIGDISCDIEGGIECTVRATDPGDPVFVYEPTSGQFQNGFAGPGVVVMAVDILPSELPRDASEDFSRALRPFLPALAAADYSVPFAELALPPEIKRAVVAHRGELAPAYAYLSAHLPREESVTQP
jgi:alpha-aminoadipic semialdehyde synthase